MISLIYGSAATQNMTEADLVALLQHAREKNQRMNITGMLLYANGNFLQVLEGDEARVNALMSTIARDPRHRNVMVYARRAITEREFGGWEMGFLDVGGDNPSLRKIDGYNNFLNQSPSENQFNQNPSRAYIMMRVFRDMVR